jgi:putative flippase GtrA
MVHTVSFAPDIGSGRTANMKLAITYAVLALVATVANIGAQDLVIRGYNGAFDVLLSVVVGTGVGLVVKYVLDKRFIFHFRAKNAVHDGQTFMLYTLMGLLTTVIFWGFEFGFDHVFQTKQARYLGGVIGLAIGYVAKYHLDKRYVFRGGRA